MKSFGFYLLFLIFLFGFILGFKTVCEACVLALPSLQEFVNSGGFLTHHQVSFPHVFPKCFSPTICNPPQFDHRFGVTDFG